MLDYLVQHAVDHVWCSPDQDYQMILRPARISHPLGTFDHEQVLWESVALPTKGERYHVYQIGHLHPHLIDIMHLNEDAWHSLESLINASQLMAEVYTDLGLMAPRRDVFLRWTRDANLIMAIYHRKRFPIAADNQMYLRVYTNAFYKSPRSSWGTEATTVTSRVVKTANDTLAAQAALKVARTQGGMVMAFHNGRVVDTFLPAMADAGDVLEWVQDHSVYRVVDIPVSELQGFDSILDVKQKYLLHPEKTDRFLIDFQDDIDVYLLAATANEHYRGVYYHRNRLDSLRMLTHQDYSIPVDYLRGYQTAYPEYWPQLGKMIVRLCIRDSGLVHGLIPEHHRIFELYRLSDEKIKRAMLGVDSTVPEWRADALEQSYYPKIMRWRNNRLDPLDVQKAYGYNAMAKLMGDTPQAPRPAAEGSTFPVVELKPGHRDSATIYEYDNNGLLLGWFHHSGGSATVPCQHAATKHVEVLVGRGTTFLDAVFGETTVTLDAQFNHRAYVCTLLGDQPLWDWVDVSNSEIISISGTTMTFHVDPVADYPAVLSDANFLADEYELTPVNGVMTLHINALETHFGETYRRVKTLPPRRLDVWLNGHPLIEDLDYFINWPEVVIVNREYITYTDNDAGLQTIAVRGTGFCQADMKMDPPRERGFVRHGYLSDNDQYDVRDDKVVSVIVGGRLIPIDQLRFDENSSGVAVANTPNGTPYSLRETIVPLRGVTWLDTYQLRDESMAVDERIAGYLTVKDPPPEIVLPSPIEGYYEVYSPTLSRLIYELRAGVFDHQLELEGHYSDGKIHRWMEAYQDLLEFEPTKRGYDRNYVKVHPHYFAGTISMSIYHVNFLNRVIDLYFNNEVNLSNFVTVSLPGAN